MERTTDQSDRSTEPAPSVRRRRRRRRWILIPLALLLVLLLLTRTWALRAFVEPRLERALGCEVAMGRVILEPDGRVVIRNLRLQLPGVQDDAAEVLRARRLDATIDWSALFAGEFRMTRISLIRPRVRLSQSLEDDALNIQAFPRAAAPSGAVMQTLPAVNVVDGLLEFGEHTSTTYTSLHTVPIEGGATPRKNEPVVYDISLREIVPIVDGRPAQEPLLLAGSIDTADVSGNLRLFNVDLSRWAERTAPARYRDQITDLQIRGVVRETEFAFSDEDGVVATINLENVGMRLPIDENPAPGERLLPGAPLRRMEMSNVTGRIQFDRNGVVARGLRGTIEDLNYEVSFQTEGLALDAPFRLDVRTVDGFTVASTPELLPFAPEIVRRRFRTFSGPTAIVDAEVTVQRAASTPEGPARPTINGVIRFRDGAAAYENFAYPVTQLAGLVAFNDEEIRIESITGVGPTGAKLFADGVISPPADGAQVDLDITFVDVPIDREFEQSMPESRRAIIAALVDQEAYAELIDRGLVQPSAARNAALARLSELKTRMLTEPDESKRAAMAEETRDLERVANVPAFDPGGLAELKIKIHRDLGDDAEWTRDIHVRLPTAGLLVSSFPYPVIASDVTVRIDDYFADVDIPSLKGLTGASGTLVARIKLSEGEESVFLPDIFIAAHGAPVDELLVQAVPGDEDEAFSAPRLLNILSLEGGVDCAAHVLPRADGEIGFDVSVRMDGVAARPDSPAIGELPDEPLVAGLTGEVNLSERGMTITELTGMLGDARFDISAIARFPRENISGGFDSEVAISGLNLRHPIERIVGALSPGAGAAMSTLRSAYLPSGFVDAQIRVAGEGLAPSGAPRLELGAHISGVQDFEFDLLGGRISIPSVAGDALVGMDRVQFDEMAAEVFYNGESCGVALLDGSFQFPDTPDPADATLRIALSDTPVESALVKALLEKRNPNASMWYGAFSPRGRFDLDATLAFKPGESSVVDASIRPRSLALTRRGVNVDFTQVEGALSLRTSLDGGVGASGDLEDLTLTGDDLTVSLSGPWSVKGSPMIALTINADAARIDERVRAALPEGVAEIMSELDVRADGRVRIADAVLEYEGADDADGRLRFDGVVSFEGAAFNPGLPIDEASGAMSVHVERQPGLPQEIDLTFNADGLRLGGLRTTNARARVVSGQSPGEVLIPVFEADAHTGRVTGSARISEVAVGFDRPPVRRYEAELKAAGVNFGAALADFTEDRGEAAQPEASGSPEDDRGLVDASVSIEGVVGDADARLGRGAAIISGGRVIRLPLLIQLIELSNLQIPAGEPLDEARASFYVDGDMITFEDLGVASAAVDIVGRGTLRWSDLGLDLRVNSRSRRRLIVVSDLLEGLRDEIATITVGGTLAEPSFGMEQLSGTRRLLESIFGPDESNRRPIRPSLPEERNP